MKLASELKIGDAVYIAWSIDTDPDNPISVDGVSELVDKRIVVGRPSGDDRHKCPQLGLVSVSNSWAPKTDGVPVVQVYDIEDERYAESVVEAIEIALPSEERWSAASTNTVDVLRAFVAAAATGPTP